MKWYLSPRDIVILTLLLQADFYVDIVIYECSWFFRIKVMSVFLFQKFFVCSTLFSKFTETNKIMLSYFWNFVFLSRF